ncbi:MAG TPA: SDR family NAD(P)-dependent oxidoreductase [Pseudomonadales bacterium]
MRVRELGLVTGASSGIGYELSRCCAAEGLDLIVVSDDHRIHEAANSLRTLGTEIVALQVDLATDEGLGDLLTVIDGRPLDVLIANAGHGLGGEFLEQDFEKLRHVIDTNITGTLKLLHTVAPQMCARCEGRILITGSIGDFMPGSFAAVYNGTKAFIDSFALALREELKESGVTVTCLLPGATETKFFERAGMCNEKVVQETLRSPPRSRATMR